MERGVVKQSLVEVAAEAHPLAISHITEGQVVPVYSGLEAAGLAHDKAKMEEMAVCGVNTPTPMTRAQEAQGLVANRELLMQVRLVRHATMDAVTEEAVEGPYKEEREAHLAMEEEVVAYMLALKTRLAAQEPEAKLESLVGR